MDWRCVQVVEHLLCKFRALSSNSNPTTKKKKKKKKKKRKRKRTLVVRGEQRTVVIAGAEYRIQE
jgi:hypothetical protein